MKCFGNALGNCLNDKEYVRLIGAKPKSVPKFELSEILNEMQDASTIEARQQSAASRNALRSSFKIEPPENKENHHQAVGNSKDPAFATPGAVVRMDNTDSSCSKTNNVSSTASLGVTASASGAGIESAEVTPGGGENEEMKRQERLRKAKIKQLELKVNTTVIFC